MQKIPEKVWISLFTIACMATHIYICTLGLSDVTRDYIYAQFLKKNA